MDLRNHVCLPCDLLNAYFAWAPATKKHGGLSAQQMRSKSRSATLSIALDTFPGISFHIVIL